MTKKLSEKEELEFIEYMENGLHDLAGGSLLCALARRGIKERADADARDRLQKKRIDDLCSETMRQMLASRTDADTIDRLKQQLRLAEQPNEETVVEIARAIDPTAWRWIDKMRAEEPDHPALENCVKSRMASAAAALSIAALAIDASHKGVVDAWKRVAVLCVAPLEALRISGDYPPHLKDAIDTGVITTRMAVSDGILPPSCTYDEQIAAIKEIANDH